MSFQRPALFGEVSGEVGGAKSCAMSSTVSTQSRREIEAPISPEQVGKTRAIRGSMAAASNTVLPPREWPLKAICVASTWASVSR
jgi:hypothetical protein